MEEKVKKLITKGGKSAELITLSMNWRKGSELIFFLTYKKLIRFKLLDVNILE